MKKNVRFVSLALALLLIVPLFAAFAVNADESTFTPYDEAEDGALLRSVNFKAAEWRPTFASDSNKGADIDISDDGTAVEFTVHNGDNYRAMWGGYYSDAEDGSAEYTAYHEALGSALPLKDGVKYTMVFDLTLGNDNVAFGIQVDGQNALSISGNGQSRWYSWNDYGNSGKAGVGDTKTNDEKWNWHTASEASRRDKTTFAVVLDYDVKTMTLYVKDINDGNFYLCRSIHYDDTNVWDSDYFRCRLTARRVTSAAPDETYTAKVENLNIYKGDTVGNVAEGTYTPYEEAKDGDVLYVANFKGDNVWKPENGDPKAWSSMEAEVSEDGKSVTLTPTNDQGKGRCAWGGELNTETDQKNSYHAIRKICRSGK